MLKDSQLAKDIKKANKLISDAQKSLSIIDQHIENNDKEEAMKEIFKYERISEKIVNNARVIPIASGIPKIQDTISELIIEENDVKIRYTEDGWFYAKIPCLLPKKEKGDPSYIRTTLSFAMKKFFSSHERKKFREPCVFIVRHNYSIERSDREYRDHDNIELNAVMDLVAMYVLLDDSPMKCKHYYCSAIDITDSTEVFIVPHKDFIKWLNIYN